MESGIVSIRHTARPRRPAGYALIRLRLAGICNTDLELQRGYYGFRGRPGHEFVGEVEASDTQALLGKRVVGEINLACRQCQWCKRGMGRHCPARKVLGIVNQPGALAEWFLLPDCNLHVVPDRVPDRHAVFTEPIAAACQILDQVKIPARGQVAVLGDGKLGLLIAQVLRAQGAQVVLFGRHAGKLRIAHAAGVSTVCNAKHLPVKAFKYVVDATGSAAGLAAAISMTQPRGTVIMKSTVHNLTPLSTAPVIVDELTLIGSRCGRMEPALRLLRRGTLRLDEMIAGTYSLTNAREAFTYAASSGVLKVLVGTENH